MAFTRFAKYATNTLAKVFKATGFIDIYDKIRQSSIKCPPIESQDCKQRVGREVEVMSLILSWLDYGMQWLPLTTNRESRWRTLYFFWNAFSKLGSIGIFMRAFVWLHIQKFTIKIKK